MNFQTACHNYIIETANCIFHGNDLQKVWRGQVKKSDSRRVRAGNKQRDSFKKRTGYRNGRHSQTTTGGRKVGVAHFPEDKGITDQSQRTYSRTFVQLEADVEKIFDRFRAKFTEASQIRAKARNKGRGESKKGGKKGWKQRKKKKRQINVRQKMKQKQNRGKGRQFPLIVNVELSQPGREKLLAQIEKVEDNVKRRLTEFKEEIMETNRIIAKFLLS